MAVLGLAIHYKRLAAGLSLPLPRESLQGMFPLPVLLTRESYWVCACACVAKFGTPNTRLETLFKYIPDVRRLGLWHYKMTTDPSLGVAQQQQSSWPMTLPPYDVAATSVSGALVMGQLPGFSRWPQPVIWQTCSSRARSRSLGLWSPHFSAPLPKSSYIFCSDRSDSAATIATCCWNNTFTYLLNGGVP